MKWFSLVWAPQEEAPVFMLLYWLCDENVKISCFKC